MVPGCHRVLWIRWRGNWFPEIPARIGRVGRRKPGVSGVVGVRLIGIRALVVRPASTVWCAQFAFICAASCAPWGSALERVHTVHLVELRMQRIVFYRELLYSCVQLCFAVSVFCWHAPSAKKTISVLQYLNRKNTRDNPSWCWQLGSKKWPRDSLHAPTTQ